jgi:hypothetical protein
VCGVGSDRRHGIHVHGDGNEQRWHECGVECVVFGYSVDPDPGTGTGPSAGCDTDTDPHSHSDPHSDPHSDAHSDGDTDCHSVCEPVAVCVGSGWRGVVVEDRDR